MQRHRNLATKSLPRRRHLAAFASIAAMVLIFGVSCVTIDTRTVEVEPENIPVELQDARWQELPVRYCLVRSDLAFVSFETFAALTNEAFEHWGLPNRSEGECDEAQERNGRNEITWGEAPDLASGPVHEAGYARLVYSRCVQNCPEGSATSITEADVLIDPEPPSRSRNEDCLFSTLLHEVGHFLGVPHLESPAVMAPVASGCPQELTAADRQALQDLYGPVALVE